MIFVVKNTMPSPQHVQANSVNYIMDPTGGYSNCERTRPIPCHSRTWVSTERLLRDLNTYGFMFENLCLRDISVYAENLDGKVFHYRDNSNLEVDAIIEMPDGSWSAFEIKLGEHQVEHAAQSLTRLRNKMLTKVTTPPACLGVITGGGFGRQRSDGIYVVPINALGP